jgi:hypothetical protein
MTIKILEKTLFEKQQKPKGHKAYSRQTKTGKIAQVKEKPYNKKMISKEFTKRNNDYLDSKTNYMIVDIMNELNEWAKDQGWKNAQHMLEETNMTFNKIKGKKFDIKSKPWPGRLKLIFR